MELQHRKLNDMISIVMAYYNRLPLLRHTLTTFRRSAFKDFEVIIVDDHSVVEHNIDQIPNEFPDINIKVIKMSDINPIKNYFNPCIPFNVGFRNASGDSIIIQNPECCHMGDVLSYVDTHLTVDNYLTFHCYAASFNETKSLKEKESELDAHIRTGGVGGKWYNHKELRPTAYHFTTAIKKERLQLLNGFDERFAQGEWFDDNEILHRVKLSGLEVTFVDNPYVIHQAHTKDGNPSQERIEINRKLMNLVLRENLVRTNNRENI